jgi:hypothetical protein
VSIPLNMLPFRQPEGMPRRLRGRVQQIHGENVIPKAGDLILRLR